MSASIAAFCLAFLSTHMQNSLTLVTIKSTSENIFNLWTIKRDHLLYLNAMVVTVSLVSKINVATIEWQHLLKVQCLAVFNQGNMVYKNILAY